MVVIRKQPPIIPIMSIKFRKYNMAGFDESVFELIKQYPNEIFIKLTEVVVPNILPRYYISNYGRVYDAFRGVFCTPQYDKDGYIGYNLSSIIDMDHIACFPYRSHRLVLGAFTGNSYFIQLEVNHKDLNKQNNYVENLEYVTQEQNRQHAKDNGVFKSMTNDRAMKVCELLQNGYNCKEISDMLGIPTGCVQSIKSGKTFKSIAKNYNIPETKDVRKPLSYNEVCKVCELLQSGMFTQADIGRELNIPTYIVNHIYRRDFFSDISKNYNFDNVKFACTKLTEEKRNAVINLIKNGEKNNSKISRDVGASRGAIRKIRKNIENE